MVGNTVPLGQQNQPPASNQNKQGTPQMQPVRSSQVQAIGYDADKKELYVSWHSGKTSVYSSVPPAVHQNLLNAPSVGKAINLTVKHHYAHRYAAGEIGGGSAAAACREAASWAARTCSSQ